MIELKKPIKLYRTYGLIMKAREKKKKKEEKRMNIT